MSEPKVTLQIGSRVWHGNAAVRVLWAITLAFVACAIGLACWLLA